MSAGVANRISKLLRELEGACTDGAGQTQAQLRGSDSVSRFADVGDANDYEVWRDLVRFLGLVEMHTNGRRWMKALRVEPGALARAISQGLTIVATNRNAIDDRAAWLNLQLHKERQRSLRTRSSA